MPTAFPQPIDNFATTLANVHVANDGQLVFSLSPGSLTSGWFWEVTALTNPDTAGETILGIWKATGNTGATLTGVTRVGASDIGLASGTAIQCRPTAEGQIAVQTALNTAETNIATLQGQITPLTGTEAAHTVFSGPGSGSPASPTFRALVSGDIPSLPYDASGLAASAQVAAQSFATAADTAVLSTAETFATSAISTALASYTGTTNLVTVGAITAGTWAGTTIAISHGGTGATSQAAALAALGGQAGPLTGDVTTSGAASTLANTAVTPGSYTNANVTFDAKGRATAAANGSSGLTVGTTTVTGGTVGDVLSVGGGGVLTQTTAVSGSGSSTTPVTGWSGVVAYLRASDVAGGDGASLTTVTPIAGTSGNFTGTATLRTAGNGIGGQNAFQGNGTSQSLSSAAGAASLTGNWYIAVICKPAAANVQPMSWGNSTGNQVRSLLIGGDKKVYFFTSSGFSSPLTSQYTITTSATYLFEVQNVSGTVTMWLNGTPLAAGTQTMGAYSSAALNLMVGLGGGNFFNGLVAEALWLNGTPTVDQRGNYLRYIADTYGFPAIAVAAYSSANYLEPVEIYVDSSGNLSYGGIWGSLTYSLSAVVSSAPAAHTFWGPVVAYGIGGPHALRCQLFNENVCSIRNESASGFAAFMFERYSGETTGASGYANPGINPWGGPNGSMYTETLNVFDPSKYGDYRIVQTKWSGFVFSLRHRIRDDTQAIEDYDLTETEPGANNPAAGLVCQRGKPVTTVANNATVNTGITTGASQCGLVIVKDATNSTCGVWRLENITLTAVSVNAEFTTTSGNASTVNVFNSSGQLVIENKAGGSLNLTAAYYGA